MPRSTRGDLRITEAPLRRTRFGKFGVLPKSIRPTKFEGIRLSKIEENQDDGGFILMRRGIRKGLNLREQMESWAVPYSQVKGSLEERIIYKELVRRRIPFDFQSSMQGGRKELGGIVSDFILLERNIIINPLGTIWHTGLANEVRDQIQKDILQKFGYVVLFVWDWQLRSRASIDRWFKTYIDVPQFYSHNVNPTTIRNFRRQSNYASRVRNQGR